MRYAWLVLLIGCDILSPIPGAEPFQPPSEYQAVWAEMVECTGLERSYWDIDWFTVGTSTKDSTAIAIQSSDGQWTTGEYQAPNRITLRHWDAVYGGPVWWTLRHEIVHALLRGDARHASPVWDRCLPH